MKHVYTTTKNHNERQNKFNALVVQNILFHFSYIQFSNVCATVVRRCLKPEFKADAEKRGESLIKVTKWMEGKPEPSNFFFKYRLVWVVQFPLKTNVHKRKMHLSVWSINILVHVHENVYLQLSKNIAPLFYSCTL